MMPRTALLAYALDRPTGGIGTYTTRLAAALREAGAEPMLVKAGAARPGENMPGMPGAGRVPGLLTIGQVEIAKLVQQHQLQLFHDPTGIYPLYLAHCRKVVTVHDAFPLVTPRTSTAMENLLYRTWLPLALPQADAIITSSEHSKGDILRYLPVREEKIFVVPIATPSTFRPLSQDQAQPILQRYKLDFPYIFFAGSLSPRKNLLRLLRAYARLQESLPGWKLVVAGVQNPWKSNPVAEIVQSLGLSDLVHFTGYVAQADMPALYNGATLFCFPTLYEGFGMPPLEAMACGTPVVASNVSSLPEVTGEAAVLVDPYDVGQIAAAMERILSDPELADDLRRRGLARASEFTTERMAQETLDVYHHVIDS
jgi:glycosyltransferase involved in cell wall biosynthesis